MSTGRWHFTPKEIKRAVRTIQEMGLNVRTVELAKDGAIRVNVGEADKRGDDVPRAAE